MKTKGFVQFNWKNTDSQEEPILITLDSNSSKVSDVVDGRTGIFDFCCCKQKLKDKRIFFVELKIDSKETLSTVERVT